MHGWQDNISTTKTLCGVDRTNIPDREGSIEIPMPNGIADPKWITCPVCREVLRIDWNA